MSIPCPSRSADVRRIVWPVVLGMVLLWLLLVSPPAAAQGIIYVTPGGTGGGTAWNDTTDLQSALAAASAGDEIWVATGLYKPGAQASDTFQLKDGVALYGGFAGGESSRNERDWQANPTVLSGDIDSNDTTDANGVVNDTADIAGTNAYHVVSSSGVTATAVLDGFYITAGSATGSSPDDRGGGMVNKLTSRPTLTDLNFSGNRAVTGGGMYNLRSSPTLTSVGFVGNSAGGSLSSSGGGMANNQSRPTLIEVSFTGNSALGDGGGMWNINNSNPMLSDVTFGGNSANVGGGMYNGTSSPALTDVTFNENSAQSGGAIVNDNNSNPTLSDVTISDNSADYGGGMYNKDGSSPTLADVTFSGNTAGDGGGMATAGDNNGNISSPTLSGVTFIGNTADTFGGGVLNDIDSRVTLTDVVFSGNWAFSGGGIATSFGALSLTNVVLSGNTAVSSGGGIYSSYGDPTLTNVTVTGNTAGSFGGGMANDGSSPLIQNSVFYGNSAGTNGQNLFNFFPGDQPIIRHSLFEGGLPANSLDGGNNVFGDPLFVNAVDCGAETLCGDDPNTPGDESTDDDYGNLRLQGGSPAVDAGDNAADLDADGAGTDTIADLATDLVGQPRIAAVTSLPPLVDMGAYERVNSAPDAQPGGPYSVDEGTPLALDGSASGDDGAIASYEWDCTDDGSVDVSAALPTGSTCLYADDGSFSLRLVVTDIPGAVDSATTNVSVANVAPVLTAPLDQSTAAGNTKSFDLGTFVDPGAEGSWSVSVDWGDDTPPTGFTVAAPGKMSALHSFAAAGTYNVGVTIDDGDDSDVQGFQVVVNPAAPGAPKVSAPSSQSGVAGTAKFYVLGSFGDADSSGPWNVTVDWGDGSPFTQFSVTTTGPLSAQGHTYAAPGTYNVLVTVNDGTLVGSGGFIVEVGPAGSDPTLRGYLPNLVR